MAMMDVAKMLIRKESARLAKVARLMMMKRLAPFPPAHKTMTNQTPVTTVNR